MFDFKYGFHKIYAVLELKCLTLFKLISVFIKISVYYLGRRTRSSVERHCYFVSLTTPLVSKLYDVG
jgi:hypothetical protein